MLYFVFFNFENEFQFFLAMPAKRKNPSSIPAITKFFLRQRENESLNSIMNDQIENTSSFIRNPIAEGEVGTISHSLVRQQENDSLDSEMNDQTENSSCFIRNPIAVAEGEVVVTLDSSVSGSNETGVSADKDSFVENPMPDFGYAVKMKDQLTDFHRHFYMTQRWSPSCEADFLTSSHKQKDGSLKIRKISKNHLNKFPWIAISQLDGFVGVWCSVCVLFHVGSTEMTGQKLGKLVLEPLKNFKDLTGNKGGDLSSHDAVSYHRFNLEKSKTFLVGFVKPVKQIDKALDSFRMKKVQENRALLVPVIESLKFLAIQNLPMRGHRDDGPLNLSSSVNNSGYLNYPDNNDGNFRQLLRFRANSGDELLMNQIKNNSSRNLYFSKTVQNSILGDMAKLVKEEIIQEIKASPFWTILADETTDIAHTERLVMTARYLARVNGKYIIKEDPFSIIDVISEIRKSETNVENGEIRLSGKNIATVILNELEKLNLPLNTLVGQGYDGASSMSSCKVGVAAHVKKVSPHAEYFHCASHALNLGASQMNKNKFIRQAQDVIMKIVEFFRGSAKRHEHLSNVINECENSSNWVSILRLCQTRFVERHTALDRFCEAFPIIVEALQKMTLFNDTRTSDLATEYLNCILRLDLLVSLFCARKFAIQFRPLAKALQQRNLDLTKALDIIDATLSVFQQWREDSEATFGEIFKEVSALATRFNISIQKPRTCARSVFRANLPNAPGSNDDDAVETYFRIQVWNDVLDQVAQDIRSRFTNHHRKIFSLSKLLPINVANSTFKDLILAINTYQAVSNANKSEMEAEFTAWKSLWKNKENEIPVSAIHALNECSSDIFPNLFLHLSILACLPVSTCEPERIFSKVSLILSDLRANMSDFRLESLVLLSCHRSRLPENDAIIDRFSLSGARKLNFKLPL